MGFICEFCGQTEAECDCDLFTEDDDDALFDADELGLDPETDSSR